MSKGVVWSALCCHRLALAAMPSVDRRRESR